MLLLFKESFNLLLTFGSMGFKPFFIGVLLTNFDIPGILGVSPITVLMPVIENLDPLLLP